MTSTTALEALARAGATTSIEADTITFAAPWGRGRIAAEQDDRVRFRCMLAGGDGPCALARRSLSAPRGARVTIRQNGAVIEACGAPAEIARIVAWLASAEVGSTPPVVELAAGFIATVVPPLTTPTFLRFAVSGAADDRVACAQATYLLIANRQLAAGLRCGWLDGPGVVVDPAAVDGGLVAATVRDLVDGIRALADQPIAESFLDYCGLADATDAARPHQPQGGESCMQQPR